MERGVPVCGFWPVDGGKDYLGDGWCPIFVRQEMEDMEGFQSRRRSP